MRVLIFLAAFGLLTSISAYNWVPSDSYVIKFSTATTEGSFTDLKGTIDFDPQDLANANFDVSVATASINTGNKTKDKHAAGESWLDAERYPRISFQSHSFQKTTAGYSVEGQLTVHGHSKAVSIPFLFEDNIFSGELTVDRKDYAIDGPFLFGGLVGDEVVVTLRIPVK